MRRKAKFRVGQVVATHAVDGGWEYERIESIRVEDETCYLAKGRGRRQLKYMRPLTKRERGEQAHA